MVVSQESVLLVGLLDYVVYVWPPGEVAGDVNTKAFSSWYFSQDLTVKLVKAIQCSVRHCMVLWMSYFEELHFIPHAVFHG